MIQQQAQMANLKEAMMTKGGTGTSQQAAQPLREKCPLCKKNNHKNGKDKCWELKKNKSKRKGGITIKTADRPIRKPNKNKKICWTHIIKGPNKKYRKTAHWPN